MAEKEDCINLTITQLANCNNINLRCETNFKMNNFSEKQRFTQWWLWLILVGAMLVPLAICLFDIFTHKATHTTVEIVSGAALPAAIIILFRSFRLDTKIDESGVWYRFFPLQGRMGCIVWADVEKAYIKKYNPILDYGGWGIRFGLGGKGKAYNIAGNMGLQLELKTGKKILIGTQQPDEVKETLVQLVREKKLGKAVING